MKNYFEDALAYINNTEATPEANKTPLKVVTDTNTQAEQQTLYISPSGHSVSTSEDGKALTVDGVAYIVPEWYSKDQIKNGDAKTIDMVLIHYGLIK